MVAERRRCVVVVRRGVVVVGPAVVGGSVVGVTVVVVGASVVVVDASGAPTGCEVGGPLVGVNVVGVAGALFDELPPAKENAAARKTVPETKRMDAHTVVSVRLFEDVALSPEPKSLWRLTGEKNVDISDAQFLGRWTDRTPLG